MITPYDPVRFVICTGKDMFLIIDKEQERYEQKKLQNKLKNKESPSLIYISLDDELTSDGFYLLFKENERENQKYEAFFDWMQLD